MRTPRDIIKELSVRVSEPQARAADVNAVVRFDVAGEGSWLVQMNEMRRVIELDPVQKPVAADCTFRLDGADFVSLFEGKLTGQQLFFDGRLDVEGDLTLTLKLPAITRLLRSTAS